MPVSWVSQNSVGATQAGSLTCAIPNAGGGGAAGQVALLYIDIGGSQTVTAITSGWTQLAAVTNGSSQTTYCYAKTLVAGDLGTNVSITFSAGTARAAVEAHGVTGHTLTGYQINSLVDGGAVTDYGAPALTGVVAGSILSLAILRRRSGVSGNITVQSPYTESAPTDIGTSFGSGVNVFMTTANRENVSGSVGGEAVAGSSGVSSIGVDYLVSLPPLVTTLDDLRAGTATVGLRVGTDTPSKVYAGTVQVWP